MNSQTPLSLLIQMRNPDEASWNRFVELYTPLLFHWAGRSGLQPHDAAELVQEVFLTLLTVLPNFEYDANRSFRAWLYTVLRNKWADLGRKRAATPNNDAGLSRAAAPEDIVDIEEAEFRKFLIHRALEVIEEELGPQTIRAFRATAIDGRPIGEVARELNMTENAIYSARRRVIQKLRVHLDGMWS